MSWMRTFRRRPLLALLLAFLVLATGVAAVGAHHDHELTSHHGDCPTCRLSDEAAGALPVLAVTTVAVLPATSTPVIAPDARPATVRCEAAHPLRGPPIA